MLRIFKFIFENDLVKKNWMDKKDEEINVAFGLTG